MDATNYFPADVSLRTDGDIDEAQKLFPAAKQLLFKALAVQRNGDKRTVRLLQPGTDGSLIVAFLAGSLKQIYVTPGPNVPPKGKQPTIETEYVTSYFFPYEMWSGAVRPTPPAPNANIISVPNPDGPDPANVPALDQFHPDAVTATAYNLDFAWQQPPKLGVNDVGGSVAGDATSHWPKPSMYSGAMKRVVQAIFGIGRTQTDTEEYISGELPVTFPDLAVWNQYDWTWLRTHGITKADDGSIWLVEIGKDAGVCAMPLPIFNGTDSPQFAQFVAGFGDTDTLNVVLEFGGLPTGEPFPTGTDLDDAITNGKVLQLLTPLELQPFYRDTVNAVDKAGISPDNGWAFSASGKLVDHICIWYKNAAVALADSSVWNTDGHAGDGPDQRHMTSQHWSIAIDLDSTPTDASSAGSGTAALTLVEETPLVNASVDLTAAVVLPEVLGTTIIRIPGQGSDTEGVSHFVWFGRVAPANEAADEVYHAPVHLFYVGEDLELVRNIPRIFGSPVPRMNSFLGTSLNPSIPAWAGAVFLVLPAFYREGYLLVRGDPAPYWLGVGAPPIGTTFPITVQGYFADLGIVVLPTINELWMSSLLFGDAYIMITWQAMWMTMGNGFVSFPNPIAMAFGLSFNAGPTLGYVMSDGLSVIGNVDGDSVHGHTSRPATSGYLQPTEIADLDIPITVKTQEVTFVGSV